MTEESQVASPLLASLDQDERKALLGLLAVCLPEKDLQGGEWEKMMLSNTSKLLKLPEDTHKLFQPLTARSQSQLPEDVSRVSRPDSCSAFSAALPQSAHARHAILRDFIALTALLSGYDARTKVTFRCMATSLGLKWSPGLAAVESMLGHALKGAREKKRRSSDLRLAEGEGAAGWRGAKIGGAMVGGGLLLALTGGLAAPAIAAGIAASSAVIGTAAAATLVTASSTAVISAVFGATGAGLAGYKMNRRTKGIQEFVFERDGQDTEMSVSICVTGLLQDRLGLRRAWGMDPKAGTLSLKETLERYFYIFDYNKVKDVPTLLRSWHGREQELFVSLAKVYGVDPRHRLVPAMLGGSAEGRKALDPVTAEEDEKALLQLFNTVLESNLTSLPDEVRDSDAWMPPTIRQLVALGYSREYAEAAMRRCNPPGSAIASDECFESCQEFLEQHKATMHLIVDQDRQMSEAKRKAAVADSFMKKKRVWFWRSHQPWTDQYVIRWEIPLLLELGRSVDTLVKLATKQAVQEGLKWTAAAGVMTALSLPLALITAADMIDSDWTLGSRRADIAGVLLADALLSREQGCRPVNLIGFGLGARMIVACLEEMGRQHALWEASQAEVDSESQALASPRKWFKQRKQGGQEKGRSAAGIVETVVLLGTASGLRKDKWEKAVSVVHGRLVNGYSRKDIILGLVYRAKRMSLKVAGVHPVEIEGIENIDLSTVVESHADYIHKMEDILPLIKMDDWDPGLAVETADL